MSTASITTVEGGVTAPQGYQAAAVACGLKPSGLDLALLVSDTVATAAGIFTTNRAVAAPVVLSQAQLSQSRGMAKAIVVNSKCANACTGDDGMVAARAMVTETAAALGCETHLWTVYLWASACLDIGIRGSSNRMFSKEAWWTTKAFAAPAISSGDIPGRSIRRTVPTDA